MKICASLAAGLAAAILLPGADPLADVFARMDATAVHFKGMVADLEETVHTQIVDDNNVSTGTIKLRRAKPGDVRVLFEFQHPEPKGVSYAGNEVHIYNPKTNIEQIYDVSTKKGIIEQAILLGFGATSAELKASYDVSFVAAETLDGFPVAHIKLVPKSKEMLAQLKQADLWISDSLGVPVQQKIATTNSGDYTMFKYLHLKMAPELKDSDLQLRTPKNVQKQRVGAGSSRQ
jgi:outer membrane lipoprotein-sorting protein